jgi:hypothetical protein
MNITRTSVVVTALLCAAGGCGDTEITFTSDLDTIASTERPMPRLKLPKNRLPRKDEDAILELLDDMRGVDADYLARRKGEETLRKLMEKQPKEISAYVVQLLDDPQWDVRAGALRLLIEYGKYCPEAVGALVQIAGDQTMSAVVRKDAVGALHAWTGEDFGYRAWGDSAEVKAAAGKWKKWYDDTGGNIAGE